MVLMATTDKLEVFEQPIFDRSLVSLHEHTYKPYGSPSFRNSDIIYIPINFQDLILDISDSYIFIEGRCTPKDVNKKCDLTNNFLAFLFDEIRYQMGGEQIIVVRNPGITTTMKTMVSFTPGQEKHLSSIGWGNTETTKAIWDKESKVFSGKLPLKYLMGFAEDYTKGILNVKQELVLIIARSFENCYIGEVEAKIEITKIDWKIKHIIPEDRLKLKLLNRLNKGQLNSRIKVPFRMWDLYELPSLRATSSDVWAIKTTHSLERPRFVLIAFQSVSISDDRMHDINTFIDANINYMRLSLNNEVYPYERWNLDFKRKLHSEAYYAYENFQRSYYNKDIAEPLMDFMEFGENPIFVIDCSHQPESLKLSTVDIKLEFETRAKTFPANTKVYALIIHDACIAYNAYDGSVYSGLTHSF